MPFRSKLLQPPADGSEAALTKIYDVYRTPAGRIEGEGEDVADILDQGRFSSLSE
jgi:hypothetical protein